MPGARKLTNMYKREHMPVGRTYEQEEMRLRDRNITKEEVEILMDAEALVGRVLGTCTLQQVIGQGGMGAVYLAQQSRPRRQIAVKVLLPATALKPRHLAAFLERFRRETDAAASLEHPNIMPVYEYGECDGLAYVVMPYVSGGTLRDVMERYPMLPLPKVLNYLEQMAAALDFAHARGVIHRDVKPANILLTLEGRLLLTDFGLVKVISDEKGAQARLTGAGAPVGTPDYMSPEQVIGGDVDGRADQYSLGIILYQMVTGTTPFQGETPMQIAAQQLHMQPASLRLLRPDLPVAAEQVILKAMAKRPEGRYRYAQDLTTAFRMALQAPEMYQQPAQNSAFAPSDLAASGRNNPLGLLNRKWQTGTLPSMTSEQHSGMGTGALPTANAPSRSTGLLSRTGMFPRIGNSSGSLPAASANNLSPATPGDELSTDSGMQRIMHPQGFNEIFPSLGTMTGTEKSASSTGVQPVIPPQGLSQMSPSQKPTTGALNLPDFAQTTSGTIKLTGPVKVVQVPVAGQPGQYITGLLPVQPNVQQPAPNKTDFKKLQKIAMAVAMVIVLIGGIGGIWLLRTHSNQASPAAKTSPVAMTTPDLRATMTVQATATAQANIILSDSLNQNIHNWPTGTSSTKMYVFKDGAYHITNLGNEGLAVILQETLPGGPIAYTLTMQEIKGDDTSINNSFGMILRYSQQSKGNQLVSTFYSFEVVDTPGGEYRFYKYSNSQGPAANPWTEIWHQVYGHEFNDGHTSKSINTFKVLANGNAFTFTVNGKVVGSAKDSSYSGGTVGMLVNLNGTEVAFSNMLITHS